MRLRNNPNAMEELKKSGFLCDSKPIKIDKHTIIELGMGKGEMITQLATENPSMKFIGVEKFATVAAMAAKRAKKLEIDNFRIVCDDIKNLPEIFDGKVETIWLTFSDPWPKARHEKRRLTHKSFLNIYKNILDKNGLIKLKTDNDKFFTYSVESLKEFGFTLSNVTTDFHSHPSSKDNAMTGYEVKWSSTGKNINYLEARLI